LTIELSPDAYAVLEELAALTGRSQTVIANNAIMAYAAEQMPIIEGILQGMEDFRTGNVIPHEEAMAQLHATIEAVVARNKPPKKPT
jgi:predicted transcriptional regulator